MFSQLACCIIHSFITWRHEQNGWHFADSIFNCIVLNEKCYILFQMPLKFVTEYLVDINSALVSVVAWWQIGDKPLHEPMVTFYVVSRGHNELIRLGWQIVCLSLTGHLKEFFYFSAKFEAHKVFFSFIHFKISASARRAVCVQFSDALILSLKTQKCYHLSWSPW